MRAFSYLRVSGKSQVDGDGFPRQRAAIESRAAAMGAEIVREYADEGISGASEESDRPALIELFAAIESNGVRLVLVERADRLARDVMVSEMLLAKFRKLETVVIDAESGIDLTKNDPDNATGTLIRQILSMISQFEKTSIVAKLRKARARKKLETGRCEGVKPFGEFPGEAATIERMRQLARKPIGKPRRMSFAKIAAALDSEGLASRSGKPWTASAVRQILGRRNFSCQNVKLI